MWPRVLLVAAVVVAVAGLVLTSTRRETPMPEHFPTLAPDESGPEPAAPGATETATFGTGCFWCTEAVFQQIKGVKAVVSGYTGGKVPDPTYEQVCSGTTGHAEALQITYDPAAVTYPELLEVFWRSHDPTTLNRQGNDVGTQYRSAIFYHTDRQRELAERYKKKVDGAGVYASPVVTEITPAATFYPAEAYHQNYYALNPRQGYCWTVIGPKVEKLRQVFRGRLLVE
ncbi:MAG TPA: peptide-methionine (S)-S-oxide reductase MsrA [Urbifossiella sp.]|jgi:peptide-methionine (S)-S-oxide reductase|nr:peptide-methionine (S)-S-oxide reductase MsrA [Urbifossiella sp.]